MNEFKDIYVVARPVDVIIAPTTDNVRGRVYLGRIVRHRKPTLEHPGPKCDFGASSDGVEKLGLLLENDSGCSAELIEGSDLFDKAVSESYAGWLRSVRVLSASWRRVFESINHHMPICIQGNIITIRSVDFQF